MTGPEPKVKILVVDDSKTQAMLLSCMLENSGFSVTMAHNADEALRSINENKPSLVITDIVMPGKTGYELCSEIRRNEKTAAIPVMLLTTLDSPGDIISALECGADDFISKPYNVDYLVFKLKKYFNSAQSNNTKTGNESVEEIVYSGKKYLIPSDRQKMLDMLISTYEATIQKNRELIDAQETLVNTNRRLETTISDKQTVLEELRVKEELLKKSNSELNIMNRIGAVINQSVTLDELLPGVASEICSSRLSGLCHGIEVWLNDENGDLKKTVEYPLSNESVDVSAEMEEKLFIADILSKEQLKIKPECDIADCNWNKTGTHRSHGHCYIRLVARDRRIGLMNIVTEPGYGTERQTQEMMISLGKQLGMAIENHNLLIETRLLSLHDPLTGLANRRMIDITLENEIARANRYDNIFCLVIMDIDYFKHYNDQFGHDEGDRILISLSSYLKENIRDTDIAARFGGEEFILIISEIGIEDMRRVAEKHRKMIQEKVGITVSMGIAEYKINQTGDELIKAADTALYRAKENGRNRVEISD